jgi:2-polyprenyl-6-methoxyphenol hydroxylase-like FAD-dependent oxidoreductase
LHILNTPKNFEFILEAMSLTTDAIVVGGSVAGLMHALVLKSLGRNVLVIEARPLDDMHAHAAGLSLWPHALKLLKTYATDIDPQEFAFHNRAVQRMTGDGVLLGEIPFTDELWTTSWAVVHKMLWEACEKHDAGDGVVSFAMGKRVCGVREQKDSVMVAYKGHDGTEEEVSASLVFAADGGRSFVRSQVLPDVEPEYAGYLAWRGILLEKDVPQELEGTLDGKLVMLMLSGSYILT